MKLLVLDDYIGVAQASADWKMLPAGSELIILDRWLPTDVERAEVLRPYQVIVAVRERTPFPAALIEALPNLRLLVTTENMQAFYRNALEAILAWQGGAPIRVLEADGT